MAELYEQFLEGRAGERFHGRGAVRWATMMSMIWRPWPTSTSVIKEDTVIREAGHVVIDEAQDFGMMAYASLKYCLSKMYLYDHGRCGPEYFRPLRSCNDWTELRKLMLPGEFDYFGILQKKLP